MRIFILVIFLIKGASACQQTNYEILILNGLTMGTTYSVKINADNAFVEKNKISDGIDEILSEINQSMSTYIKESELSNINFSTVSDWQSISDDLFEVIDHAMNISLKTNGAFDITIAPLVNLWGFGPDELQNKIPTDEIIELTKKNTGYKKISIDKSLKKISKLDPNLHIDLSGIAKGFAVDKIARYLDKHGFKNYLIEIGGELIGKGLNKDNEIWQIGIENPNNNSDTIKRIVQLKDMAMATSGNYMNYFEKDGVRYSHTINPVTGKPIKHKLASVTVLDNSAMNADALATAFMVLGPEKALSLANNLKIAVYLIIKDGKSFEEKYNDYFTPYLSD
jgi:FAD:protein FMN transferase